MAHISVGGYRTNETLRYIGPTTTLTDHHFGLGGTGFFLTEKEVEQWIKTLQSALNVKET